MSTSDDLMLMPCNLPQFPASVNVPLQPGLPQPPQAGDPRESWGFGSLQSSLSQLPATGKLAGCPPFLLPVNSNFKLPRRFLSFPICLCLVVAKNSPLLGFHSSFCTLNLTSAARVFVSFTFALLGKKGQTSFLRLASLIFWALFTIYSEFRASVLNLLKSDLLKGTI